jgi:hypothetical protein
MLSVDLVEVSRSSIRGGCPRTDFSIPSNKPTRNTHTSFILQSPAMQFHVLLAALALFTAVQAAAPLPRELVEAVRSGTLERRLTCEVPIIGGGLCVTHCQEEHPKHGSKCTGVCNSASVFALPWVCSC